MAAMLRQFLCSPCLSRVKSCHQPINGTRINRNDIKSTRGYVVLAREIVVRGKHNAPLFGSADAGCCATMACGSALANLDKHARAVRRCHDQVNLAAAAPGHSIIAHNKTQTSLLQVGQRQVFCAITFLFGGEWWFQKLLTCHRLVLRKLH